MPNIFSPSAQSAPHNLFFAVRPSEEMSRRIFAEVANYPHEGTAVRPDRLHITLLPLIVHGIVPAGLCEEAAEIAENLRAAPFSVVFDRLVSGEKSALLLPSEPLDALRMFREKLGFSLMRGGVDVGLEGRFNPHVTVAYGNRRTFETQIDPIIWTVEEFVLIDSHIGITHHETVGRWRLRA